MEQLYWNNNFVNEKTLKRFENWVGQYDCESKLYLYKYLENKSYQNIIDLGCATGTIKVGLEKYNIKIDYLGVDSCDFFISECINNNINVLKSDIRNVPYEDKCFDLVFGRHVIEHQECFKQLLCEMIRLAKKEVIHIFFIKPSDDINDKIIYDKKKNLYHNIYSKNEIDKYLKENIRVISWYFNDINQIESVLHINVQQ